MHTFSAFSTIYSTRLFLMCNENALASTLGSFYDDSQVLDDAGLNCLPKNTIHVQDISYERTTRKQLTELNTVPRDNLMICQPDNFEDCMVTMVSNADYSTSGLCMFVALYFKRAAGLWPHLCWSLFVGKFPGSTCNEKQA